MEGVECGPGEEERSGMGRRGGMAAWSHFVLGPGEPGFHAKEEAALIGDSGCHLFIYS